jgi:hypothetical protein
MAAHPGDHETNGLLRGQSYGSPVRSTWGGDVGRPQIERFKI